MTFVLFLVAYGGGPTTSAPAAPAGQQRKISISGSLYDGPIEGAAVYIDVNRNRRVDAGDYLIDEATDSEGNFDGEIPERYGNFPLIADNRGATHHGDSNVTLPPFFVTPAGSRVISPITHIVELRVVTKAEVDAHPLFDEFRPFTHNPYLSPVTHPYSNLIKAFLPELTALIASTPTRLMTFVGR